MKNSRWALHDVMAIFVLMILFSSSWLMAKDAIMISSAEIIGDVLTLSGAFEIKPGKSSKGGGDQIVVTLDGEPLEILSESPDVIEALMPFSLAEGTHRVAVCEAKDKECPDLEKHQLGNQIDITIASGLTGPQGDPVIRPDWTHWGYRTDWSHRGYRSTRRYRTDWSQRGYRSTGRYRPDWTHWGYRADWGYRTDWSRRGYRSTRRYRPDWSHRRNRGTGRHRADRSHWGYRGTG